MRRAGTARRSLCAGHEPRAGAVVREVKPSPRDRKGRVLVTALDAVARTIPPPT